MAQTRFGDAHANGQLPDDDAYLYGARNSKRRSTRFYANPMREALQPPVAFREFTPASLAAIRKRRAAREARRASEPAEAAGRAARLEPDPCLASGQQLPLALVRQIPAELVGKPIEDIDPYYSDQETFVIISRGKELTRFSAKKALYLLGPFHPIRRIVLCILVSSIFNLLVITTILTNCILMTIQGNEMVESTETIFTIIYTTELGLKVLARGFIVDQFTYLRDPWNWLDFTVIIMAYLTIVVEDLGNLSVMRTFRVLRALKTVAIIPGMKTIVGAVIDSVKNLKDVVVLTLFSLSVFSLLGLQIYMGLLTQKCILNGPGAMEDGQWFSWCNDSAHWIADTQSEIYGAYRLCGNATGAQACPQDYTCLQGFGPNPDYGYTNFDTFGWALICSFRLMTQDYWEGLYMQVLKTAGSWHIIFFIVSIFLGSIYLMNLILAIVAMSYNELQRRAEEEEEAAAEDEAAFLESCRLLELEEQLNGSQSGWPPGWPPGLARRAAPNAGAADPDASSASERANTSYRPSVEIGLVGQTLLASLCQNGLLSQRVREKLDQQMMLPGAGANRSHSLSTSLEPRRHSRAGAGGWLTGQQLAAQQASQFFDPFMMAASMTELRRKSSARTSASYSPASTNTNASLLGQRRLLPNIGVTGNRLDGRSLRDRRRSQLASQLYLSASGGLQAGPEAPASGGPRQANLSASSDRDLQTLKEKAALIRIQGDDLDQQAAPVADSTGERYHSERLLAAPAARARPLAKRPSVQMNPTHAAPRHRRVSTRSCRGLGSLAARSDHQGLLARGAAAAAVCEQPSRAHPFGRLASTATVEQLDELGAASQQQRRVQRSVSQRRQARRNSARVGQRRHNSTLSIDLMQPAERLLQSAWSKPARLAPGAGELRASGPRQSSSMRTLHRRSAHGSPLEVSPSGSLGVAAGRPQRLAADVCLKPLDRMHHLSVENFQQFGVARRPGSPPALTQQRRQSAASSGARIEVNERGAATAATNTTSSSSNTSGAGGPPRNHSLVLDSHVARRLQSMSGRPSNALEIYGASSAAAAASSGQRGAGLQQPAAHIHPATMARSSMSRRGQRHSMAVGSLASVLGAEGARRPHHMGASVRRMSRDFVRHADDWSRLSMSANVDMRRLLRLWSHTNPYQGVRPSLGSCSMTSQAPGVGRPLYSPAGGASASASASASESRRPSSVNSVQAYEMMAALTRLDQRQQWEARASAAALVAGSLPLDEAHHMEINARDRCIAYCLSCLDILCIWECCPLWLRLQRLIGLLVFDPFTELFIILCILINTLFMALDSDDADAHMRQVFERGNYFFTATFAVEAAMKIVALSPKFYFREGWNVFDAIIVGLSLLELGLEGVYGLSVLRSFRLLRVFKLAKSWPTLNLLISIMGKAVGDLGNLTFVLAIIVFIFAVMGMQLFGTKYVASGFPSGELPRWNFTDFMHSFMIVFRILCAEWIEPMWDCLLVGGWPCIPFFLIAVTVGNLVVLNLFLALLLASFGASNLSSPQADNVDTKKLQEAIGRFRRFGRFLRRQVARLVRLMAACVLGCRRRASGKRRGGAAGAAGGAPGLAGGERMKKSHIVTMSRLERLQNIERRTEELKSRIRRSPEHNYHLRRLARAQLIDSAGAAAAAQRRGRLHLANIPIIVNEAASDCNEEAPTACERAEGACNSSLGSDVSLELSLTSNEGAASRSLSQSQAPYSMEQAHDMHTIREDSHDSFSSSASLNSAHFAQPLPTHHLELQANRWAAQAGQRAGDAGAPDENKWASMSQLAADSAPGGECARQLREPLLVKSSSGPANFQEAGGGGQQVVVVLVEDRGSCGDNEGAADRDEQRAQQRPKSSLYLRPPKRQDMEEEDERALQHIERYIERCICFGILCLKWFLFRQHVRRIVEHKYFDQCILVLIIISSGTLALEDKHLNERPTLKRTLDILDTVFTIIFSLEMILKWLAFGLRRYFGNIWSWLDFVIVLVSLVNLLASIFGSGKIQALKTMRTLRAMRGLRPLRALQRFQGMRVVVNALIQAIPSIFNVLLVCLIFWLIFSIMGVQMFGGKFWRCLSPETREVVSYELAANRFECLDKNLTWANPQINFDNVPNAYLALFQVATFKGWIDIMNSATDSRMRDDQPIREANIYMYLYFVFFVIFGSFFTLNLFIGVIIDNFNEQKKKTGGSLEIFMTDDQKKYYHAMKKMRSKRPVKAIRRPKFKLQAYMFDITTSKKFDLAIMLIIGLNMLVMALEHYGQSAQFTETLETLNLAFIAIFTLECLCKIFAMRHFYFREPWNLFDFIVVDLSILGVVMKEYVAKYFVSPTLLRVVRVVKVGRVLRLVKGAKGIRTLLFALAMSLPALFNICLLLFLVMFIYAIFGMSFFMNVRKRAGVDETFNFETFTSSIIVLFQMSTSAGWDLVLDPLMDEENDCQKPDASQNIEGTCGNKSIAIFYLISYVIVTFLIIINMYIAVILENYSQATEDVQQGLTDDDYEMYYEIWQRFDPDGTQYLPHSKLSDFVDALEEPLRIAKPNELALVVLDVNIYQGNQCYCVDILDALTKYFFTRKGLDIQVNEHLRQVQSTLHETPFERITTTYLLKREHYCARLIQNCWRKWRQRSAAADVQAKPAEPLAAPASEG